MRGKFEEKYSKNPEQFLKDEHVWAKLFFDTESLKVVSDERPTHVREKEVYIKLEEDEENSIEEVEKDIELLVVPISLRYNYFLTCFRIYVKKKGIDTEKIIMPSLKEICRPMIDYKLWWNTFLVDANLIEKQVNTTFIKENKRKPNKQEIEEIIEKHYNLEKQIIIN